MILQARAIFNFAVKRELLAKVNFGTDFAGPGKKALRRLRNQKRRQFGPRMFTADELRRVLDASAPTMRALVLLGINCGVGNSDLARLPVSALDLETGWLDFPRGKTEVERRVPLWTETVDALKEVLRTRRAPRNERDADLVFLTKHRTPLCGASYREDKTGSLRFRNTDAIGRAFRLTMLRAGVEVREGRGFYAIRHCVQTVADEVCDPVATAAVMGHAVNTMSGEYREEVQEHRLRRITDHIHAWLFGPKSVEAATPQLAIVG
jgi:integrase